jgi:hypothetical protein
MRYTMDRGRRTKEYIEQFREVSFLVDGAHLPFAAVIVAAFLVLPTKH